jgi:hypothetical protein
VHPSFGKCSQRHFLQDARLFLVVSRKCHTRLEPQARRRHRAAATRFAPPARQSDKVEDLNSDLYASGAQVAIARAFKKTSFQNGRAFGRSRGRAHWAMPARTLAFGDFGRDFGRLTKPEPVIPEIRASRKPADGQIGPPAYVPGYFGAIIKRPAASMLLHKTQLPRDVAVHAHHASQHAPRPTPPSAHRRTHQRRSRAWRHPAEHLWD